MEGSVGRRPRRFRRSIPRCRRCRPVYSRVGRRPELARRGGAVDHFSRRGLCRDARARLQCHGVRQGDPRRLLRERPRHRARPRPHLLAVHPADAGLRGPVGRRLRRAATYHGTVLSPLRRARLGARDEVHPACALRDGRGRAVGRERAGAARVRDRDAAGRHGGKGPPADPPPANADVRPVDPVLLHPGGVIRLGAGARRRAAGLHCSSPKCSARCWASSLR